MKTVSPLDCSHQILVMVLEMLNADGCRQRREQDRDCCMGIGRVKARGYYVTVKKWVEFSALGCCKEKWFIIG